MTKFPSQRVVIAVLAGASAFCHSQETPDQTGVVNAAGFVGGAVMRTLHISGWQACIRRTIRF